MASYKKSLNGSSFPWRFSTKADFCLPPLSRGHGLPKGRPLSLKPLADGQRSLRFRRLVYRLREDGLRFISVSILCGISDTPKSWDSLGTFSSITREASSFSGTPALSIGHRLSKVFLKAILVFMRTFSPATLLRLTLMSSSGGILNTLRLMVFRKIHSILKTPFFATLENLRNQRSSCGRVSGLRSCHGGKYSYCFCKAQ